MVLPNGTRPRSELPDDVLEQRRLTCAAAPTMATLEDSVTLAFTPSNTGAFDDGYANPTSSTRITTR